MVYRSSLSSVIPTYLLVGCKSQARCVESRGQDRDKMREAGKGTVCRERGVDAAGKASPQLCNHTVVVSCHFTVPELKNNY